MINYCSVKIFLQFSISSFSNLWYITQLFQWNVSPELYALVTVPGSPTPKLIAWKMVQLILYLAAKHMTRQLSYCHQKHLYNSYLNYVIISFAKSPKLIFHPVKWIKYLCWIFLYTQCSLTGILLKWRPGFGNSFVQCTFRKYSYFLSV